MLRPSVDPVGLAALEEHRLDLVEHVAQLLAMPLRSSSACPGVKPASLRAISMYCSW